MMRVIGEAMLKVRRQVIRDETEILYAIEHGTPAKVSSLISVDPWLDIQETIQEELFAELVSGGQRIKLPTIRKEVLSYRFDATRPEAANWAAKEAGTLIRQVGEEQVSLVREYVSQASMGEYTPRQVARNLRDVIGLTSAQAGWVENFRSRQISEQMARGKSYDQAYVASEKATERYHARIHRYRTETIARTEILRASHEGRREGWRQGIEEGYISAGASKQWSTELDGRECEICAPLDGEVVLIDAEFSDGEPPIHPNCRCDVLLVDFVDEDLEGLSSEELDSIIDDLLTGESPVPISISTQSMPYEINPEVRLENFADRMGRSSSTLKAQVQTDLEESFVKVANQDVEVRLSGDALSEVLREGRFRNAYEVSERSGNTEYMSQRNNIERNFVGVPTNARVEDRPIYGAIHNPSQAARYGEVSIVLRPEVKERTTMGVGDSFNGVNPVPIRDVLNGTATIDDYSRATSGYTWNDIRRGKETIFQSTSDQYWEAQVHGGIGLQDIAQVRVSKNWLDNLDPSDRLILDRSGIDVIFD
jgi:hypothetical protein